MRFLWFPKQMRYCSHPRSNYYIYISIYIPSTYLLHEPEDRWLKRLPNEILRRRCPQQVFPPRRCQETCTRRAACAIARVSDPVPPSDSPAKQSRRGSWHLPPGEIFTWTLRLLDKHNEQVIIEHIEQDIWTGENYLRWDTKKILVSPLLNFFG